MKHLKKNTENLNLKIIELELVHLKPCLELDSQALDGLWSKSQWARELSDSKRISLGIINCSELIALGCGWLVVDEVQINALAVHPDHRGLGLGTMMIKALLQKAKTNGVTHASLEVKSTNIIARSLYQKLGFHIAGLRSNYYKDGSDALILKTSLLYKQSTSM